MHHLHANFCALLTSLILAPDAYVNILSGLVCLHDIPANRASPCCFTSTLSCRLFFAVSCLPHTLSGVSSASHNIKFNNACCINIFSLLLAFSFSTPAAPRPAAPPLAWPRSRQHSEARHASAAEACAMRQVPPHQHTCNFPVDREGVHITPTPTRLLLPSGPPRT